MTLSLSQSPNLRVRPEGPSFESTSSGIRALTLEFYIFCRIMKDLRSYARGIPESMRITTLAQSTDLHEVVIKCAYEELKRPCHEALNEILRNPKDKIEKILDGKKPASQHLSWLLIVSGQQMIAIFIAGLTDLLKRHVPI